MLKHFIKSRLSSRVPIAPLDMMDLLEAKDIAQPYELWCFFEFVSELQSLLGAPSKMGRPDPGDLQISLHWEFEIGWADGTRIFFNPRFSRSRSGARFAYSVPLRPDIAVEVPAGRNAGLHLFDAKFRVHTIEPMLSDEEETTVGRADRLTANREERSSSTTSVRCTPIVTRSRGHGRCGFSIRETLSSSFLNLAWSTMFSGYPRSSMELEQYR